MSEATVIPTTPAMRAFNDEVEAVDQMSDFQFDRLGVSQLARWLRARGNTRVLGYLETTARAVGAWED